LTEKVAHQDEKPGVCLW